MWLRQAGRVPASSLADVPEGMQVCCFGGRVPPAPQPNCKASGIRALLCLACKGLLQFGPRTWDLGHPTAYPDEAPSLGSLGSVRGYICELDRWYIRTMMDGKETPPTRFTLPRGLKARRPHVRFPPGFRECAKKATS